MVTRQMILLSTELPVNAEDFKWVVGDHEFILKYKELVLRME